MTGRRFQIPATILRRITKVFITNLPEKCSGNNLSDFIRSYGDIYDLYIARKRDKAGNCFGFVSFLDVKDRKELIRQICNTRIGDCWLIANIARFTLKEGEIRPELAVPNRQHVNIKNTSPEEGGRPTGRSTSSFFNGSRSFSDTLTGKKDGKSIMIGNGVNACRNLHRKALVARMFDLDALKSIHVILNDICPSKGKVQYLGGLSILISFEDEEVASSVLVDAKKLNDKFSAVDLWEGQTFGFERLAWLKLTGLPLHLITSEVIDAVGSSFGKIIHRASRSDGDDDLSFDYIRVLVGDGKRISESVTLVWRERKFNIWVAEDNGEWVPEFYMVSSSSSDMETGQEILKVFRVGKTPKLFHRFRRIIPVVSFMQRMWRRIFWKLPVWWRKSRRIIMRQSMMSWKALFLETFSTLKIIMRQSMTWII
ncbi:putative RNA recognition motif domain, nucleotide-binding alpha-beta plait domain superfamily [Helianthus annuus]|nr:putative RNA recognition motif domain, nucleotide-binding alpha-beta plait domain superfamily [Helianthus annuus]